MEKQAAAETAGAAIVSTHPTAASRLARCVAKPLAERIYEYGIANRTPAP
jgi:hypothetical protein